jgi:hypothetical protein
LPEKNIIQGANGHIIGRLFADGFVYNRKGIAVDKFISDGSAFYSGKPGKILQKGYVVDFYGELVGFVNDNAEVIDDSGTVLGVLDANGRMFNSKGEYKGGLVRTGVGVGYDGSYLGYVSKSGKVIDIETGKTVGVVSSDGHILNTNKQIIGEVTTEDLVVDVLGSVRGYLNARGEIIDTNDEVITSMILPGGISNNNHSVLKKGVILNYSGKVIGIVGVDGSIISTENKQIGHVLGTGQAVNDKGQLIGEIADTDIVINEQDKVIGFVNYDGKVVNSEFAVIGKVISPNLAVDNNGKILGHTYKIGANILDNGGQFFGRVGAEGRLDARRASAVVEGIHEASRQHG